MTAQSADQHAALFFARLIIRAHRQELMTLADDEAIDGVIDLLNRFAADPDVAQALARVVGAERTVPDDPISTSGPTSVAN